MGNMCASSQFTNEGGGLIALPSPARIIQLDGGLQEIRNPTQAKQILSQNPDCFLCTSESMELGSWAPQVHKDEVLQLGKIYFLMPLSQSRSPLSLQDLCSLAIKASGALANNRSRARHLVSSDRGRISGSNGSNGAYKVLTGIDAVGMSSTGGRPGGRLRIEL